MGLANSRKVSGGRQFLAIEGSMPLVSFRRRSRQNYIRIVVWYIRE